MVRLSTGTQLPDLSNPQTHQQASVPSQVGCKALEMDHIGLDVVAEVIVGAGRRHHRRSLCDEPSLLQILHKACPKVRSEMR